jgi:hypothetical protein
VNHNARTITLTEDDRRRIGFRATDCAERVLPLFETQAPGDTRPREASEALEAKSLIPWKARS